MMRFVSLFLFGLPLLAMAASIENQEADRIPDESMIGMEDLDAETLAMLRGSSSEGEVHGRQLWGFSFTNLLFAVGYCPSDDSKRQYCCALAASDVSDQGDSSEQSLCKCPDCSKNHPLLPKKLCKCYGNEVYDPDATFDSAAADYEVNGEDSNADEAGSSKSQSAKSRFNMWAYIIGGSGVALLIGALIMRKRQTDRENDAIASSSNSFSDSASKRLNSSDGAASTIASGGSKSVGSNFVKMDNLPRSPTGVSEIYEQSIEVGPAYPSSKGGSNYVI